ncbi:Tyrosine-protein phosphatase [Papilio xuthus]|uniref:Tyrosine-protein phosphatase n=1 Tax=Papilio xuthus TaxID=66420 RepID=A0A194PME7_PAPXU|nr:Tyrosine-protein phosphatase [Papilio xuthus]
MVTFWTSRLKLDPVRWLAGQSSSTPAMQVKHVEENNIWDITQLLLRIPNIGAVLDLTNTARYYNPKNFEAVGVLHKKIFIPGRAIPPEEKVSE